MGPLERRACTAGRRAGRRATVGPSINGLALCGSRNKVPGRQASARGTRNEEHERGSNLSGGMAWHGIVLTHTSLPTLSGLSIYQYNKSQYSFYSILFSALGLVHTYLP